MSESAFHYVFSDLDSTLLAPNHQLSPLTKNTLKTLSVEKQVPIVIATGRIHFDVARVAQDLVRYIQDDRDLPVEAFPGAPMYLVTSNGAVIHNALTDELLQETCIDPVLVEEMYRFLPVDTVGINTNVFQRDQWICRLEWPEMNDQYVVSGLRYIHSADPPHVPADAFSAEEARTKNVTEGCFHGISNICFDVKSADLLPPLAQAFQARFGDRAAMYSLTFSTNLCMDIMATDISKGAAVPVVLDRLRGRRGETLDEALAASVAFGDGLNDQLMLEVVGRGFVMSNANPKLIAACPKMEVIPSNADDGVARTLRNVFQLDD